VKGFLALPIILIISTILIVGVFVGYQALKKESTTNQQTFNRNTNGNSKSTETTPSPSPQHYYLSSICSKFESKNVECFEKRNKPIIYAILYQYGSYLKESDLKSYIPIFEERFNKATKGEISLKIIELINIPIPKEGEKPPPNFLSHDYSLVKEKYPWIKDESSKRIWYNENLGFELASEAYEAIKKPEYKDLIENTDLIITLTEAEFEAIALHSGRIILLNQPSTNAWAIDPAKGYPDGSPGGYRTVEISKWSLSDELNHEIGHSLGLVHPSQQCTDPKTLQTCCKLSPNANDVMSPCRDRSKVSENFLYQFEACTMEYIKGKSIQILLNGGLREIQPSYCQ